MGLEEQHVFFSKVSSAGLSQQSSFSGSCCTGQQLSSHEVTELFASSSGEGPVGARRETSGETQQAEPQAMVCERKAKKPDD
jgi:hypothetical protein